MCLTYVLFQYRQAKIFNLSISVLKLMDAFLLPLYIVVFRQQISLLESAFLISGNFCISIKVQVILWGEVFAVVSKK